MDWREEKYTKFLEGIEEEIKNQGLEITFKVKNFADWQPQVEFNLAQEYFGENGSDTYLKFWNEYCDINNNPYGNISHLLSDCYIKGEHPAGWSTYKIPQRIEYAALREKILDIADAIKRMGLIEKNFSFSTRSEYNQEKGRHEYYCRINISRDDIWKMRDWMYNAYSAEFEAECKAERRAEMLAAEYQFGCGF